MNISRYMRRSIRALCAAVAALVAAPAAAAIVDCAPAGGQFTVFLSEPGPGPALAERAQVRRFLERLQFELDQNRDGRWINAPASEVRFVACFNRAPALDGQDFNATLVEGLHSQRVLLEIWGALANDGGTLSAQMNYLLVPIRFAADQRETVPAPLQRLRYPEAGAATVTDPVQLIARPLDIDAFVAAALGFKLLREKSLEPAHANLCRAHELLRAISKRPLTGRTKLDVAALDGFVLRSAGEAVRAAVSDARYPAGGVLRLHDAARPCGED